MLQELSIKNFAIIENLQISFEEGMTVLTGETGAGKSIIIDAVGLLAGGRGSSDLIRYGEEKTVLQGLFTMPTSPALLELLEKYGVDHEEEENQILLQRELTRNGKNVSRVNGTIVTVTALREIGEFLIDIHGQSEHQELMDSHKHLPLLDRFAGAAIKNDRDAYLSLYSEYQSAKRELERLLSDEKENVQRLDLLRFQIDEIEKAQLEDDEEEEKLIEERNMLANYQKIMQALTSAYDALQGEDGVGLDAVGSSMVALEKIQSINASYGSIYTSMSEAYYQLQDASSAIRDEIDSLSYDEGRLNEIELRLEVLHQLKRKYGSSIAEVKEYYQSIAEELDRIENRESYTEKLTARYQKVKKALLEAGQQLSKKRREVASKLEKEIQTQLKELYMEKAQFQVAFKEGEGKKIRPDGIDLVEFYISTNIGEPAKPLAKIASGGELSRMMLAMKTIFTQTQGITSIIFDEVDTGVSGRVAQAIANKIHLVARHSQVLCITHLPQVAAMADHHLFIQKEVSANRTLTHVSPMQPEERVEEIARMITGTEITELSLAHAHELLDLAKKEKAHGS